MNDKKMFIVRKYIMAKNASEAIRLDKNHKVDDVYVDSDWRDMDIKSRFNTEPIGFYK